MATRTRGTTRSAVTSDFNDAMVVVGEKLGLYAAIAEMGDAGETEIAGRVGVDRQQWLAHAAGQRRISLHGRPGSLQRLLPDHPELGPRS